MSFFPVFSTQLLKTTPEETLSDQGLHYHSRILETLFHNFECDIEQVTSTIDPILTAQSRCQLTSLYIQGIASQSAAFLCSNINLDHAIGVTQRNSSWSIGRSSRCSITIDHPHISLCHAAIGYQLDQGFFITDVGSEEGTWVNRRLLKPAQRCILRDGDLIELGSLRIEFFLDLFSGLEEIRLDETCY